MIKALGPQTSDHRNGSFLLPFASPSHYATSRLLSELWLNLPSERHSLVIYVGRAKAYRNDCGCAMGGAFVVVGLVILLVSGFGFRQFHLEHWIANIAFTAAFLFGAAAVGKLTGISIARWRLVLLGRELRRRYGIQRV